MHPEIVKGMGGWGFVRGQGFGRSRVGGVRWRGCKKGARFVAPMELTFRSWRDGGMEYQGLRGGISNTLAQDDQVCGTGG